MKINEEIYFLSKKIVKEIFEEKSEYDAIEKTYSILYNKFLKK